MPGLGRRPGPALGQERRPGPERRAAADALVARLAGVRSEDVGRLCPRCGSAEHGRPIVAGADVQVSVTYAGDRVVVAVADAARWAAIGIDAEQHRRDSGAGRRRRGSGAERDRRGRAMIGVIRPGHRATLHTWTRVEAVLKADGRGLSLDPAQVRIERGTWGWIAEGPAGGGEGIRYRLLRVWGGRGVTATLALAPMRG